eukprot:SAG11_NODE_1480_length_4835_cov_3.840794_1_plen_104_part_00
MLTEKESKLCLSDTGASTTLDGELISNSLINPAPSNLKILGFHGSKKINAMQSGMLLGYPVGSNVTKPFTIMTTTVHGINQPLLSFTDFDENRGRAVVVWMRV